MVTAGPSRNTVVMQKRGDRWLIVQFHNSPTPKPAP
jgi:ketosteroid isomerase-like protein